MKTENIKLKLIQNVKNYKSISMTLKWTHNTNMELDWEVTGIKKTALIVMLFTPVGQNQKHLL